MGLFVLYTLFLSNKGQSKSALLLLTLIFTGILKRFDPSADLLVFHIAVYSTIYIFQERNEITSSIGNFDITWKV